MVLECAACASASAAINIRNNKLFSFFFCFTSLVLWPRIGSRFFISAAFYSEFAFFFFFFSSFFLLHSFALNFFFSYGFSTLLDVGRDFEKCIPVAANQGRGRDTVIITVPWLVSCDAIIESK